MSKHEYFKLLLRYEPKLQADRAYEAWVKFDNEQKKRRG